LLAKIHTCAGLLTFVNLIIFGAAGVGAALEPGGQRAAPRIEEWEFHPQAGLTDRQIAARAVAVLHLPLATPVHDFAIQHDAAGRLVFDFYHANGRNRATLLAPEGRLRVEVWRASLWKYLGTLHVTTGVFRSGDSRMQCWAWYNEFAMWCLLALMASGLAIWLRTRPRRRHWVRRLHFFVAAACLPILLFYVATAIRMAHRAWWGGAGSWMQSLDRWHRTGSVWAGLVGVALWTIGATGLWLWFEKRADRRWGGLVFGLTVLLTGGLAVWMRGG